MCAEGAARCTKLCRGCEKRLCFVFDGGGDSGCSVNCSGAKKREDIFLSLEEEGAPTARICAL